MARCKIVGMRATMNLARLLSREGRYEEARTILAEIYNCFTEGFDTTDLKEARALLDELEKLESRRRLTADSIGFGVECTGN